MVMLIRTEDNEFVVLWANETKAKVFTDGNDASGFFLMKMKEGNEEPTKYELLREKLLDEHILDMEHQEYEQEHEVIDDEDN